MKNKEDKRIKAINLINEALIISAIRNFSISLKKLLNGEKIKPDVRKPMAKLIGALTCNMYKNRIKLEDPYDAYAHWFCGFAKEFVAVTNQLDKRKDKNNIIEEVESVFVEYILDKDTFDDLWYMFVEKEREDHEEDRPTTVSAMKNLIISPYNKKLILDQAISIVRAFIYFKYQDMRKLLTSIFGYKIFLESHSKSRNITDCLMSNIVVWR